MGAPTPDRRPDGRILLAGIDEAGYGPRLGPLCIGVCAFEAPAQVDRGVLLWRELRSAVGRTLADARKGKLAVADSKKLKRANNEGLGHSIGELERTVYAIARELDADRPLDTDAGVLRALTGEPRLPPWYEAPHLSCPIGTTPEHVSLGARLLRAACARRDIAPRLLNAVVVDEARFNSGVASEGSKAGVSMSVIAPMLARLSAMASSTGEAPESIRLVLDRQGGRTRYAEEIERRLPGACIRTLSETVERSSYEVELAGARRPILLDVQVGADDNDFCVALASMAAKLVRELLMARFNRHWGAKWAELKPTAGYGTDAGRWIRDATRRFGRQTITPLVRTV